MPSCSDTINVGCANGDRAEPREMEMPSEIGFFKEISLSRHVWVARRGLKVLALSDEEGGLSLPVWSDRKRLREYLNSNQIGANFHLTHFPVETFEKTFLENTDITTFQINPSEAGQRGLVVTVREFKTKLDKVMKGRKVMQGS